MSRHIYCLHKWNRGTSSIQDIEALDTAKHPVIDRGQIIVFCIIKEWQYNWRLKAPIVLSLKNPETDVFKFEAQCSYHITVFSSEANNETIKTTIWTQFWDAVLDTLTAMVWPRTQNRKQQMENKYIIIYSTHLWSSQMAIWR